MAPAPTPRTDLHTTAAQRLRADGQRYTAGRRSLVDVLQQAGRPLTAAEILAAGSLSQSSAYRNLAVLETCGVVHRVAGSDEFARFELAEDLTEHHHHLICSSCGKVEDFTASAALERTLARDISAVGDDTGFSAEHHRLDLLGTCARCRT